MNRMSLAALAALVACSACREAPPPPPPASPPRIVRFAADNTQVNPGTPVKLTYEVEGATALELIDETGAFIELNGDVRTGEATVSPLKTHFYVLRASGQGGRDSAFVQVAVGAPLKDAFLIAVPSSITAGESAQLLWGAFRNKSAEITASTGAAIPVSGDSGSVTVTPSTNTTYTLIADPGTGAPKLSIATEVRVAPKIASFTANPAAARATETIKLAWKVQGGTRLRITEATFGTLLDSADAAKVADGTHDFVIPATLPSGGPVADGLPLKFKLRIEGSTPDSETSMDLTGYVGSAPIINTFTGPSHVTRSRPFELAWTTQGADSVSIRVDGQLVFQTLPGDAARAGSGKATLPAPGASKTYELWATNSLGISSQKSLSITLVELPIITVFNAPMSTATSGAIANYSWTTQHATRVTLRTEAGTNLHSTGDANMVSAGNIDLGLTENTTVILEAMNEAGDAVTSSKNVLVPPGGFVRTDAGTSLPDTPIFVNYDVSSLTLQKIAGVPDQGVPSAGSVNFVDLTMQLGAKEISFSNSDTAVTTITPGAGFRFPFFGRSYESFDVDIDGVIGLSRRAPSTADNTNISAANLGDALAVFWDTLQLGATGKVHWFVEGSAYPRRLIVQWSRLEISGQAGADVTFQAQLYESGEFRYVYGTLTGPTSGADDATIGVQAQLNRWQAQSPSNTGSATIASGAEVSWFNSTNSSGSFFAAFPAPTRFPIMALNSVGKWILVDGPVKIFAPGSLIISEAMPVPQSSVATTGQWVEIHNASQTSLNVGGLILRSSGSAAGGYVLPEVDIAAGATALFGQSTNTTETDGAPVQYIYSDVPMAAASDTLTLATGNGTLDTLAWTTAPAQGRSLYGGQPFAFVGDGGTSGTVPASCVTSETFNATMTSYGTPGAANKPCLKYKVEAIIGAFEDISAVGQPIFTSTSNDTSRVLTLPTPITYFGQTYNSTAVATAGFLKFGTSSSTTAARVYTSATASPQGIIGPFWDHLHHPSSPVVGRPYWHRVNMSASVPVGYYVFSWQNMDVATSSGVNTGNIANAQAKIFDNGVIEFHYGALVPVAGSSTPFGTTGTSWIEEPGAARALAVNRKEGRLRPFSGYRFTPVP